MNLDIRENVINKIKNDDISSIVKTIDESVITGDELVLPGLGVMLELFWNGLDNDEKMSIANIIRSNVANK